MISKDGGVVCIDESAVGDVAGAEMELQVIFFGNYRVMEWLREFDFKFMGLMGTIG